MSRRTSQPSRPPRINVETWLRKALKARGVTLTELVYEVHLRCDKCGAEWFEEGPVPALGWVCGVCTGQTPAEEEA